MLITLAKLLVLTIVLNLVRYFIGGPIEAAVLMEPMHRAMPLYPDVWDTAFSQADFIRSLGYNFALWFVALLQFHLIWPSLTGPMVVRSLQAFAISMAFFIALAAVYMNHFIAESRAFFAWSIVDALILFPLVGLANGLLYPLLFREKVAGARS